MEYKTGLLTEHIAQILCSKELRNYEIICDSADPRLIKEIRLVAKNKYKVELHITPVKKSNNSIMPSIDKMTLFNINVTENSYNIIKELKSYTYVKDREGKWLNKPIDNFNHAIDAVRYVVMERLLGRKKRRGIRITR
jgi:phage terminase large subunit